MPMIYAHRGASGTKMENTMEAFREAHAQGADGVELDVQLTADGEMVVFHDETLDRLTKETGFLCRRTWQELSQVRIPQGESALPIPRLEEVLTFLKAHGMKVNIELKNSEFPFRGMEEKVLHLVQALDMEEDTLYSSFNHYSMMYMKSLSPKAKCGLLYTATLMKPWTYARAMGADALHPHFSELRAAGELEAAHGLGLMVNTWTVNDDGDLAQMVLQGADIIITNYPARAREILGMNREALERLVHEKYGFYHSGMNTASY